MCKAWGCRVVLQISGLLYHIAEMTPKPMPIAKKTYQLVLSFVDDEDNVVQAGRRQAVEHKLRNGLVVIFPDDGIQFFGIWQAQPQSFAGGGDESDSFLTHDARLKQH